MYIWNGDSTGRIITRERPRLAGYFGEAAAPAHKFDKCVPGQVTGIEAAFVAGLRAVNNATAVLGSIYGRPSTMTVRVRDLLNWHFHTTSRGNVLKIFRNMFRIHGAMQKGLKFECNLQCGKKGRCGYAWATQWFGGRGDIHICFDARAGYCSFTNLSAQEQAALIIHEAAHRHVGIDDKAYVWERKPPDARDYTKLTSGQAIDNADSYAWFAVDL
jgi:hypothetical protein